MTTRRLDDFFSARPDLRPLRALLHPAWLGALAVLGLNDHLLKGAGLLPGALTGKLSDIAGMLVAPVLLAALLGVRSRRGLLLCHVAVGLVFSLINLSPACADAWSWLMGLVGFPWQITVDASDLLALPALALGWRVLVPAMREGAAPRPAPVRLRPRPAEAAAAALGTLLCVATSRPNECEEGCEGDWGEDDWGEWGSTSWGDTEVNYLDITADVYLNNASDETIALRIRELRPEVQVDCINAADDPGLYFTAGLFTEGSTWTLPPWTNAPARQLGILPDRVCYAVLVESDTLEPTVLFWQASDIQTTLVAGQTREGEPHSLGAVILAVDADQRVSVRSSEREVVFPVREAPAGAQLPQSDAARVAWSDPPANGEYKIAELDEGDDGCVGITFDLAGEPRWYLCLPPGSFPFQAGETVEIEESGVDGDLVTLARRQGDAPDPVPELKLAIYRGADLPNLSDTVLAAKPIFDAAIAPDPVCGTVAQPQEISASFADQGTQAALAGESLTFDDGTNTLVLHVAHAERRVILDAECAEGPDELGDDLEIVAIYGPSQP